ncbi:MAG: hypothetical protein JXB00_12205 [Bacteroidales bacterium]|nr:hypothetical protein [Bacteroidales bacterium]
MILYQNVAEFRLPKSSVTGYFEVLNLTLEMVEELSSLIKPERVDIQGDFSNEEVINLASNLYAVESAIGIASKDPARFDSYARTMNLKLKKLYEMFKKREIEIINHTGEPYYDSMKVEVLSFDISPIINRPTITETIEPTVYYKGAMIKIGKVIVTKSN